LVVERDADIRAAQARSEAQRYRRAALRTTTWPTLSAFYRYTKDDPLFDVNDFVGSQYLSVRLSQDIVPLLRPTTHSEEFAAQIDLSEHTTRQTTADALLAFRQTYIDLLQDSVRVVYYSKLDSVYAELLKIKNTRYLFQEDLLTEVLDIEQDLFHYRALGQYHANNLRLRKQSIAAYLNLDLSDVVWDDIDLQHPVDLNRLTRDAAENNPRVQTLAARASLEYSRESTRNGRFRLSPFVGFQLRGRSTGQARTSPEIGVRLSLPLATFARRRTQPYTLLGDAWMLRQEKAKQSIRDEIALLKTRYAFLQAQIADAQKLLRLIREKERLQQDRREAELQDRRTSPGILLILQAQKYKVELRKRLLEYERHRTTYEIMHRAGLNWMPPAGAVTTNPVPPDAGRIRALWVWNPGSIVDGGANQRAFFALCQDYRVNHIYLSLNKRFMMRLQADSAGVAFLRQLKAANITVSALMGEPSWLTPEHRDNLIRKLQLVMDCNETLTDSLRFSAVHLDIEPQSLPEWSDNKPQLLQRLLELTHGARDFLDSQHHDYTLELDIPPLFAKVDAGMLERLVKLADSVTIMAYQDSFDRVLKATKTTVGILSEANTPFVIGIKSDHFDDGRALGQFEQRLIGQFESNPDFAGVAIHDFHRFKHIAMR